jgi:hypothetical protein
MGVGVGSNVSVGSGADVGWGVIVAADVSSGVVGAMELK